MGGRKGDGGRKMKGEGVGLGLVTVRRPVHRVVLVLSSLPCCVCVPLFRILIVLLLSHIVVVPGVSELGWDELGTGVLPIHCLGAMSLQARWHTFHMCPLAVFLCIGIRSCSSWGVCHCLGSRGLSLALGVVLWLLGGWRSLSG